MKAHGWSADSEGCAYYRLELPARYCETIPTVNMRLPDDIAAYDVVIGQRVSNPGATIGWAKLGKQGKRRIYEVDDDLFNIDPLANVKGDAFYNDPDTRARVTRNIQAADMVICSTIPLAESLAHLNNDIVVRPNCVDAEWLDWERPRRNRLTIGWAGSSTHCRDFQTVSGPLKQFLRRNPAVDFHTMGAAYLAGGRIRHTPWVQGVDGYMKNVDFDIGIAPLLPHVFNRSKSCVKFLEYSALGIPTVASEYGPYSDAIEHGVTGLLVRHDHEWGKHLRALVEDEAMRVELGANAREWVRRNHTMQANAHRWDEIVNAFAAVAA